MGNRNKVIDLREPFEVNDRYGSKTAYTLSGRVVSRYLKRKSNTEFNPFLSDVYIPAGSPIKKPNPQQLLQTRL